MERRVRLTCLLSILLWLLPPDAAAQWRAGEVLTAAEVKAADRSGGFVATEIDDATFARMQRGGSFPMGCTVSRGDLRYLRLLHYNFDGRVQRGELVCNKSVAADLLDIFRTLYENKYRIERMVLIDEYGADDETSMADNNSSAFCFRRINGSARLSKHAQGLAVDINPVQNPCVSYNSKGGVRRVEPGTAEARKNISRSAAAAHQIDKNDLCYRLFTSHGFRWGGAWRTKKDYQHFEK
jgi:hypothetical protein